MIYAIRAVGTEFVKVGKAASVGKRLKELETGSPHELHIEAVANWPDDEERRLHRYLRDFYVRGEWFKDCARLDDVIKLMRDQEDGLGAWRAICEALGWMAAADRAHEKRKAIKARIKEHQRRLDRMFTEAKPLLSPEEKRRAERAEYWRMRAKWTNKNNTALPSALSGISPQSNEPK